MIGFYGRKGNEEIFFVPRNFYIYTCGLITFYSVDPNELETIDRVQRRISRNPNLEENDWDAQEANVPDIRVKILEDLCYNGARDERIFGAILQIFDEIVPQIEFVSSDARKRGEKVSWE